MKPFRILLAFAILATVHSEAMAACSTTYPVGSANDGVVSFLSAGTNLPAFASTTFQAVEEGSLTYDSATHTLQLCDGTAWQTVVAGGGGASQWLNGASGAIYYNGGNVGIGTTNPSANLHINGALAADVLKLTTSGGGNWSLRNFIFGASNDGFSLYDLTNSAARLVVQQTGNVGIGTSAPTYLLSLGGNAARTVGMERHTTANTAGNALTLLAGGATSGATDKNGGDLVLSSGTATGTGSSNITFKTAPAGTTGTADRAPATAMTILGNGNVGIGTTAPSAKLEIGGTETADEARIAFGASDGSDRFIIETDLDPGPGNDLLGFRATSTIDNILVLKGNGNVGIGTTSPQATLHVSGTIRQSGANVYSLLRQSDATTSELVGEGNLNLTAGVNANLRLYANSVERMRVAYTGNVGIGTTNPQSLLHVASTGYAQFEKTFAGAPTAADCDDAAELGRVTTDTTNGRFYVCTGAAGWMYASIGASGGSTTIAADSLDFSEFKDAMTLDASTDIAASGTNVLSITNTGTGASLVVNDQASDTSPFVIDASGKVGIGTNSPSYALDVLGDIARVGGGGTGTNHASIYINAGSNTATSSVIVGQRNSTKVWGMSNAANAAADMLLDYKGTLYFRDIDDSYISKLTLDTNGNVGIGTAYPGTNLHLYNDVTAYRPQVHIENQVADASSGYLTFRKGRGGTTSPNSGDGIGGIAFQGRDTGGTYQNAAYITVSAAAAAGAAYVPSSLAIATTDTTGTAASRIQINGAGNVGIGTTNPGAPLVVSNTNDPLFILNKTSAGNTTLWFQNSGTTNGHIYVDASKNMYFSTVTTNPAVKILANGNVGIGTTSPGADLEVGKTVAAGSVISKVTNLSAASGSQSRFDLATGTPNSYSILALTDSATPYTEWSSGAGVTGGVYITAGTSSAPIVFRQSNSERMRIDSAGNVGIGTTNPESTLHVPDGKYAQFADSNAGAPPAADCDADAERGRQSIDTTNNRLYICNGATRGWDYIALTD